jgi:uncharacterized DUF497 family protein
MPLRSEWDPDRAKRNFGKHHVSFSKAATVFGDLLSITFYDPDHWADEERYITIGLSSSGKVLIVAHTDRDGTIRIISARSTIRKERMFYEEQTGWRTRG